MKEFLSGVKDGIILTSLALCFGLVYVVSTQTRETNKLKIEVNDLVTNNVKITKKIADSNSGNNKTILTLQSEVAKLKASCQPVDVGRNIYQCLQPEVGITALRACFLNFSYLGFNEKNNRYMLVQCLDDYMQAKLYIKEGKR